MKRKSLIISILTLASFSIAGLTPAYADPTGTSVTCKDGQKVTATKALKPPADILDDKDYAEACKSHGGYKTPEVTCRDDQIKQGDKCIDDSAKTAEGALNCAVLPQDVCNAAKNKAEGGDVTNTGVFKLILFVLNILTAGIGIVAVGAVVYAGILYSSAGDNAAQVQQAKDTIKNTIIGIIAFALMYLILNWLIPGGIFKS